MTATHSTGELILACTLTCPECGARHEEIMPTDACVWRFDCPACGAELRPLPGRCCVYCSYGTAPCPPAQGITERSCS
ncbi:MAG TPA: GDCCVxC domain-containing (seleno)protein [Caulobacteraceae bacterium]